MLVAGIIKKGFMRDLHIHTKYSDGEFGEYQIIEEVLKSGVTEFAICDHDTFEGSKRVFELLKQNNFGLTFHTGVELTCRLNGYESGVNMHVLVRDFNYDNPKIQEIVKEINILRRQKVDIMVNFVEQEFNLKIPNELLNEKLRSTNSFGKPHLYSILCEIGNFDREKYYRTMDKLNTAHLKLDTAKTVEILKGVGSIFLAHPIEIMKEYHFDFDDIEKLIAHLKELGFDGVETYHSSQTKKVQEELSRIAHKYNLKESEGSDFHGPNVKPNLNVGDIQKVV